MPLTKRGRKIKRAMMKTYGKKTGATIFYKWQNKHKNAGTHKKRRRK